MSTDIAYWVLLLGAAGVGLWRWRTAVALAMLLLVFEGALRKWIWPEGQQLLYFAKDSILIGAYVGFLLREGPAIRARRMIPLLALSLVAAVYGAVELLNEELPSMLMGLLGWKAYFLYVPLVVLVPHLIRRGDDLERVLRWYLLLVIGIAALGVLQFYSPAGSALNVYARGGEGTDTALFGEAFYVRATGTFAYVTGFSTYLLAMGLVAVGLLGATSWRIKKNWLVLAALVAVCGGMLTTGSRAPVYSLVAAAVVYVVIATGRGDIAVRHGLWLGAIAGLALVAVMTFFEEPAKAFRYRATSGEATAERAFVAIEETLVVADTAGVVGYGIGTMHQAGEAITGEGARWWAGGIEVESEPAKIILELGVVGFLLVYAARVLLVVHAMGLALRGRLRRYRNLGAVLAAYFIVSLPGGVVFNPTADVYYWFGAGLLYLALYLDGQESRRLQRVTYPTSPLASAPENTARGTSLLTR
jgi:hypothetical protein